MPEEKLVNPSMPSAPRNKVAYFNVASVYQDWMEEHPWIEIISVVSHRNDIVITYREGL